MTRSKPVSPKTNPKTNPKINHRYLGLELSGAKNPKTTLTVLEHYPKENKIFLLEVHEGIGSTESQTSDEFLIDLLKQAGEEDTVTGINVPLGLPPCIQCTIKQCPMPARCVVPEVKWMRKKGKSFTPYTQRPVELFLRYELLPTIKRPMAFEIDETLGGSRGPLTARYHYLKRHLGKMKFIEVSPKLSLARLASSLKKVNLRSLQSYRKLEDGAYARREILEAICDHFGVFVYDGDQKKLSRSLNAFDAFICGLTAILAQNGKCVEPPRHFPKDAGWISYPK